MAHITLILGGARSGKSTYALQLAEAFGKPVTFLATAQTSDAEMSARIQKHKLERPEGWHTLESPLNVAAHVSEISTELVILDCVTLWASNVLMQFVRDEVVDEDSFLHAMQYEVDALLTAIHPTTQHWLIVSNEVGLGLVPPYQMGRIYRDGLGWVNQRLAQAAEDVLFMVAGIPMKVKAREAA